MLAPSSPRELNDAAGLPAGLTLPLALTGTLRLTPEEFAEVCAANPDAVLELAPDGALIPMTPIGSETSGLPLKLFDSSGGFRLPDHSVLSPDASLVTQERWQALSEPQRRGFAPPCPDLVVELASPSDEGPRGLTALRQKRAAYPRNGARLGWLLIPQERAVEVWGPLRAGAETPLRIAPASLLSAEPWFPGLSIALEAIWAA